MRTRRSSASWRRARAARAPAPARGAAADRARLGDAPAAGTRRLGRARRRAGPAQPRGARRAQRRARAARRAGTRPARGRGHARGAGRRSAISRARCEIDPTPQEVPWTVAARRGRRARHLRRRSGGGLPRRRDPRRPRPRRLPRALPRPLDAGQRVVGLVRPRGQPVLRPARRSAVRRLHHAQRDGRAGGRRRAGGPATRATPRRPSTPTRTRRRRGSPGATLSPAAARWDAALGEYVLDWDDVCASPDPHAFALEFARSAFRHACLVCGWSPELAASAEGTPPPVA